MASDPLEQFLAQLPFHLDPFQLEAMRALADGRSALVAAPTGTGKTVIAEFSAHLALSRNLRAIYTTPIKALSNQKFRDFRARYGDEAIGLLTGDLVQNPSARLLVMTTEVARNMLVQDRASFQDVGCLIFDEVHYLADPERGTAWEESILLAPPHVPLVCLSATVANAEEIADWIRATGRDVALIESAERAVPLKHRYFLDGSLHPILEGGNSPRIPTPSGNGSRPKSTRPAGNGHNGNHRPERREEATEPPEVVRALAGAGLLPAIYFMFSRRAVMEAAESCQRSNLLSAAERKDVQQLAEERLSLLPALDRTLEQVELLVRLLPKGVAFHHAGLLPPLKTLVEELLAEGKVKVVFATDTLALGINVPARSVVLGDMVKFDGQTRRLISPGEYRQLTGRAGRRGMDPVGYSILLHSPWIGLDRALEIADGEVAPLQSAFSPSYSTVLNLWHEPEDEARLAQLVAGSLRQFHESERIRSLVAERQQLEESIESIPAGCPLDGGQINWLDKEKELDRALGRAQSALDAALYEKGALEQKLGAWPWQFAKKEKKEWIRSARQGEIAYSRKYGWGAHLGPSSEGIAFFLFSSGPTILSGYGDLDYLPDPPLQLAIPDSVAARCVLLDGAADGLTPDETSHAISALATMGLPDLEEAARQSQAETRAASAETISRLDRRISAAREAVGIASRAQSQSPCRACPIRADHRRSQRQRRSYSGLLVGVDRELQSARAEVRRQAAQTLRSLRSVLDRLGYLSGGKPTRKAEILRRLFDSNGLVISELLDWGVLADASPVELAEVASWFAFDREGSGRALGLTERLSRMRAAAETTAKQVTETERRYGTSLSNPLSPEFKGVALAWATGATLADISARSGLAEGDIVFALQKTLDLCRQIGQAAIYSRTPSLAGRAAEADRLLRRGVVASYYRWILQPTPLPAEA